MAAEYSSTTTLVGTIDADYINKALPIACSAIDSLVALPVSAVVNIPPGSGKVVTMGLFTRAAGEDHTEGTPLEPASAAVAQKQATAAGYGLLWDVSDLAISASAYALEDFLTKRAAEALMDALETDIIEGFTNASTSYNGTGVRLTVAGFLAAKAQLAYTNNARGTMRAILYSTQIKHLIEGVTAASGSIWGNSTLDASIISRGQADGFAGVFCGVPVYASTHVATSSSDKIGAIFVEGNGNPNPPWVVAIARMPYVTAVPNPLNLSQTFGVGMHAGIGEVCDYSYVKIISLAAV